MFGGPVDLLYPGTLLSISYGSYIYIIRNNHDPSRTDSANSREAKFSLRRSRYRPQQDTPVHHRRGKGQGRLAFYEAYGVDGILAFEATIDYLKEEYPNHFIIADAKRGDIGNTSKMYAKTFFEEYDVDALTVAPYMGEDSVTPFLDYDDKWVILLALTSNKGSHDFQLTEDANGERLFEKVLKTSQQWGNDENMMYVVGATQGRMFEDIRKVVPNHFLLVPGVGAQGGSLQEVCQYGMTKDCGLLVNSSRGIIYASNGEDFAEAAADAASKLQQEMAEELKKAGL